MDVVEEADFAPAAEGELVDDRRHELEVHVFAVEKPRVGREHVLRKVLDERVAHDARTSEQLVWVLDVAADEELDDEQRLLVDRDANSFERVAVGVMPQQLEQPAASLVDRRRDVRRCVVVRQRRTDDR